eukprot:1020367-Prymnesium_polylepis.1
MRPVAPRRLGAWGRTGDANGGRRWFGRRCSGARASSRGVGRLRARVPMGVRVSHELHQQVDVLLVREGGEERDDAVVLARLQRSLLGLDLPVLVLLEREALEDALHREQLARLAVSAHEDVGEGACAQKLGRLHLEH